MGEYVETDYLWEAIGNIRNAQRQPCYKEKEAELTEIVEELDDIHDALYYRIKREASDERE